ncbi:hypothetical protein EHI2019_000922700 [Entamoeba histolytica]
MRGLLYLLTFLLLISIVKGEDQTDYYEPGGLFWGLSASMVFIVVIVLFAGLIIDAVKMKYFDVWKGI